MSIHITNQETKNYKNKKSSLLLKYSIAVWVLFCVMVIGFVVNKDFNDTKQAFQSSNTAIIDLISDRILIAETSLEGFAANIKENRVDHTYLSQIAGNLLRRYPFLYMFEVAQRIESQERTEKEIELQSVYPGFHIRWFDYENSRQWLVSEEKEFYFPIIFQEPYFHGNQNILGLDLSSSDILVEAMKASNKKGIAIASRPFTLAENLKGYVIHRSINHDKGFNSEPLENDYYALLAIASERLFNFQKIENLPSYLSITYPLIKSDDNNPPVVFEMGDKLDVENQLSLFPILTFSKSLSESIPSQPYTIKTQYKLTWNDFSLGLVLAIISIAILIPVLSKKYVHEFIREELLKLDDKEELYRLANFDNLTGLPNRARLFEHIEMLIAKGLRKNNSFTIFFIDLDNFKPINDEYGHSAGDYALCEFSIRLSTHMRENELLARFGGDEFVLVVDNDMDQSTVEVIKERIKRQFLDPIIHDSKKIFIKLSIGEATFPIDGKNIQSLLDSADSNMYKEKKNKKSSFDSDKVTRINK